MGCFLAKSKGGLRAREARCLRELAASKIHGLFRFVALHGFALRIGASTLEIPPESSAPNASGDLDTRPIWNGNKTRLFSQGGNYPPGSGCKVIPEMGFIPNWPFREMIHQMDQIQIGVPNFNQTQISSCLSCESITWQARGARS